MAQAAGNVSRRRVLAWGGASLAAGALMSHEEMSPEPVTFASWTTPTASAGAVRKLASHVGDVIADAPQNAVALTIDDGPHPVWTRLALNALRQHDVQATFCVIGEEVHAYPNLVRQIVAEGHSLCNHTMTHVLRLASLASYVIHKEITDGQSAIADAAGVTPTLFRSPGGSWAPSVFSSVDSFNLIPIAWAVDPRDWARPGTTAIIQRLLAARPGDILLCHDGGGNRGQTIDALQVVIPDLKARGLQFTPL